MTTVSMNLTEQNLKASHIRSGSATPNRKREVHPKVLPNEILTPDQAFLIITEVERLTMVNRELVRENDELRQTKGPVSAALANRLLIENDKLLNYISSLQKEIELLRSHQKEDPREFEEKIEKLIAENQRQYLELEAKSAEIRSLSQRQEIAAALDTVLPAKHKNHRQYELDSRWLVRIASMEKENAELMKKLVELQKFGDGGLNLLNKIHSLEEANKLLEAEKARLQSLLSQKEHEVYKVKEHSRKVLSRLEEPPLNNQVDVKIDLGLRNTTPVQNKSLAEPKRRPGSLHTPRTLSGGGKKFELSLKPVAKQFDEDEPDRSLTTDGDQPDPYSTPQKNFSTSQPYQLAKSDLSKLINITSVIDFKSLASGSKSGLPEDLVRQLENYNKEIKALLEENSKLKL